MLVDHQVGYAEDVRFRRDGDHLRGHDVAHLNAFYFLQQLFEETIRLQIRHLTPDFHVFGLDEQQDVVHGEHAHQSVGVVDHNQAENFPTLFASGGLEHPDSLGHGLLRVEGVKAGVHDIAGQHFSAPPLSSEVCFVHRCCRSKIT